MKKVTQRREDAKTKGFASMSIPKIIHPAGEQYFIRLPFISHTSLRLCVRSPIPDFSLNRGLETADYADERGFPGTDDFGDADSLGELG